MATRHSSVMYGASAASILESSWAVPMCRSRPSTSMTAMPLWLISPQARSTPTKCTSPPCLIAPVSLTFVTIPDVLATRYASAEMAAIWSPEAKVVLERQLWVAVLRAQAELGVEVPADAVADYERVIENVDLAS